MTNELKMINASLQMEMELLRNSLEECYEKIDMLQKNADGHMTEEQALALERLAEGRMKKKMSMASKMQRALSVGQQVRASISFSNFFVGVATAAAVDNCNASEPSASEPSTDASVAASVAATRSRENAA